MPVIAVYHAQLVVRETWANNLGQDLAKPITAKHQTDDAYARLSAETTVPVSKCWCRERQLTGGLDALDLTALPDSPSNKNFTGLRIQIIKIRAHATNTAAIYVQDIGEDQAGIRYPLWGDISGQVWMNPKAVHMAIMQGTETRVSAQFKMVYITSTDLDAKYDIMLVAG